MIVCVLTYYCRINNLPFFCYSQLFLIIHIHSLSCVVVYHRFLLLTVFSKCVLILINRILINLKVFTGKFINELFQHR